MNTFSLHHSFRIRNAVPALVFVLLAALNAGAYAEITRVVLIPFSHQDIGFTATQAEVAQKYVDIYNELPAIMERIPEFKFTVETFWQFDRWLATRPPKDRVAFYADQVKKGRIEFMGAFGSMHSGFMNSLTLKETFRHAGEFAVSNGFTVTAAMMNDVPGYTADLPDVMAGAGIKYFMTGVNQGLADCNELGPKEYLFWWEGPSGGRVLTWISQESYMEGLLFKSSSDLEKYVRELERDGYPYDTVAVMVAGDNRGYAPGLIAYTNLVKDAVYLKPGLTVGFGTPAEFFRHMTERYGDRFPVKRGDWSGWWDVLKNSGPYSAAEARRTQNLLERFVADRLADPRSREYRAVVDPLIEYDEHANHGTAGWPGLLTQAQLDESNRKVMEYATTFTAALDGLVEKIFARRKGFFYRGLLAYDSSNASGYREVVFAAPKADAGRALAVVYGGKQLTAYPVPGAAGGTKSGKLFRLFAEKPAAGKFVKLEVKNALGAVGAAAAVPADGKPFVLENTHYRLELSPDRSIASVQDRKTGSEVGAKGFGELYESYNPLRVKDSDLRRIAATVTSAKTGRDAESAWLELTYENTTPLVLLRVELLEKEKSVRLRYVLDRERYLRTDYRNHSRNYYLRFPVGTGYAYSYSGPASFVKNRTEFTALRPALLPVKDGLALSKPGQSLTFASRQAFMANYYDAGGYLLYHLLRDYTQCATKDMGIADMNDIEPGAPRFLEFDMLFTSGSAYDGAAVERFMNPVLVR